MIYRGKPQAANARELEQARAGSKVSDCESLAGARRYVILYVYADTEEIFGYEALARGVMRSLRSPEVMFEVAEEADLIWELSRLCRARALEGLESRLNPGELLFINVDPHDFTDPLFGEQEVLHPERVVLGSLSDRDQDTHCSASA